LSLLFREIKKMGLGKRLFWFKKRGVREVSRDRTRFKETTRRGALAELKGKQEKIEKEGGDW